MKTEMHKRDVAHPRASTSPVSEVAHILATGLLRVRRRESERRLEDPQERAEHRDRQ